MSFTYYPATSAEVRAATGLRPGAVALLSWLRGRTVGNPARLPAVDGGYNKRKIRGSLFQWSVHASGRALDFGMDATWSEGVMAGNLLVWALMSHAEMLGIQYIIWNGMSYKPGRDPKPYTNKAAGPHRDHLHIELTPHAADHVTYEWIKGVTGQG